MMGYIVNLTVILDAIFGTTAGNATEIATLKAMGTHVRSGCRDDIHRDIRSFVTETFSIRFAIPEKDLVLEKIISLTRLGTILFPTKYLTIVGLSSVLRGSFC